jgi:hypothetical protein
MTYADLFILSSSGKEFSVWTEADTSNIKVICFPGGVIYEYAE